MSLDEGHRLVESLGRRWRRRRAFVHVLRTAALGLPFAALLAFFGVPAGPVLIAAATLVVAVVLVFRTLLSKPSSRQLARHLDRALPELQDSSELLLEQRHLNLLERLQRRRVLDALAVVDERRLLPWRGVTTASRWLALSAAASAILWGWTPAPRSDAVERSLRSRNEAPIRSADDDAVLRALDVTIAPPAYTGRRPRPASELDLEVEEGARVTWTVRTAAAVEGAQLVFDHRVVDLDTPSKGTFSTTASIERPHLYYLRLEAAGAEVYRSPFARLEVVADTPPTLEILRPEPFIQVDPERPGLLEIRARAADDYGVSETAIRATLVAGTGERVEFREERFDFTSRTRLPGGALDLGRTLDLAALGLEPGTELYFFIEAFDNREPDRNRSRTATHIVRAPGARGLSVDLGDGIPILSLPDYFRSQRQIIIDTEKLLAELGQITEEEFRRRSQELGFDQGALRLRYGTLLGLEFEDGQPVSDRQVALPGDGDLAADEDLSEQHDHGTAEASGQHEDHAHGGGGEGGEPVGEEGEFESQSVAEVMEDLPEGLFHAHDSAATATFFTSDVKTLLKSAIAEMWESELHLRLFEPDKALPFENRALQLLKSAQQAERVYVQRIGFDAPVVKPGEKRLTGDLDGIDDQRHGAETKPAPAQPEVRRALAIVGAWRRDPSSVPDDFTNALQAASRILSRRAAEESGFDLEALDHLRLWIETGEATAEQLAAVERALWRLLPEPTAWPARRLEPPSSLFESYRERLGRDG